MVTSVPLSLRRDWDLLAKTPRKVMFTESAERKRRILWGTLLGALAVICLMGQSRTFPRVNMEFLPVTFTLIGMLFIVALITISIQESSLREHFRFLEVGVPHIATIIRRTEENPEAEYPSYQVVYCFVTPERVATGALSVSKTRYDELELDTPLIVLVDPNDSYRFIVYDLLTDVALKP